MNPNILKCCVFNSQSIVNKLLELQYLLYTSAYDCILITESWLKPDITDGVLDPKGLYHIFRKDRAGLLGGGVCIFVRRGFSVVSIVIDDKFSDLEIIGVTLSNFYPKLQLFAIYRPPYYDCGALQDMKQLVDCLTQCTSNACIHIIAGDFNLPRIIGILSCVAMMQFIVCS